MESLSETVRSLCSGLQSSIESGDLTETVRYYHELIHLNAPSSERAIGLIELFERYPPARERFLMIMSSSGIISDAKAVFHELTLHDKTLPQEALLQIAAQPLQESGLVSADDVKMFMKQRQTEIYGREHPLLLANASENYASLTLELLNSSPANFVNPLEYIVDGHLSYQKVLSLLLDVLAASIVSREFSKATEIQSGIIRFLQLQVQNKKFSSSLVHALSTKLQSREEWGSLMGLTACLIESKVIDIGTISLLESSTQIHNTISAQFSKYVRLKHSERSAVLFNQGQEAIDNPPKRVSAEPQTQHQALTESLIAWGLYSEATPMLTAFPHFKDLSPIVSGSLGAPLNILLSELATCRSRLNIRKCLQQLLPMIEFVGPAVARTPGVLDSFLRCTQALVEDSEEMLAFAAKYTLPMMTVVDYDMAGLDDCASRLHKILQKFSFSRRERLYDLWQHEIRKANRATDASMQLAERNTRDCLKRISNQNYQEMVQLLAKVSITSPVSCLAIFISQVENYDKIASLIVQSASAFRPLQWDILSHVILSQLKSGRKSSQNDGLHNEKWLQALSNFIGRLGARYEQFRLEPLLQHLSSQLQNGDSSLLVILRDILHHAGGIPLQNNLTQANILGLMGTPIQQKVTLRMLGLPEARPTAILEFVNPLEVKMALYKSLCALSRGTYNPDNFEKLPSTKLLTHHSDQIHLVTLQYIDLIRDRTLLSDPFDTLLSMLRDGFSLVEAFELTRKQLESFSSSYASIGGALKKHLTPSMAAMLSDEGLAAFWCMSWGDLPFTTRFSKYLSETLRSRNSLSINTPELFSQDHFDWLNVGSDDDLKELMLHLLSRAKYSPQNALYVAGFILRALTRCNTLHFLRLLDALYTSDVLLHNLEASTVFEVENLGVFLTMLRKMLAVDSRDWALFEQQYMGFPGQSDAELEDEKVDLSSLNHAFRRRELVSSADVTSPDDLFTEEDLEASIRVWDYCLGETLENGLDNTSYIVRQNSIILLRSLSSVFPTYATIGDTLLSKVDHVASSDHRDDLKLASTALTIQLKKASSSWISLEDLPTLGLLQSELSPPRNPLQESSNSRAESSSPSGDNGLASPSKPSDHGTRPDGTRSGEGGAEEQDQRQVSDKPQRRKPYNRRQRNRNNASQSNEGSRDENKRREYDRHNDNYRDGGGYRNRSGHREDNGRQEERYREDNGRSGASRRADMRRDDLMPSHGHDGPGRQRGGWRRQDGSRHSGSSSGRNSGGLSLPSRPDRNPRSDYRDSNSDRRGYRSNDQNAQGRDYQGSGDSGSRQSGRGSNKWRHNKRGYDGGENSRKRFRS